MNLPAISATHHELEDYYKSLWSSVILTITKTIDKKKILAFLPLCCIIDIDSTTHKVIIGVPNDFIRVQVERFCMEILQHAVNDLLSPQFKIHISQYTPQGKEGHPHTIDIYKLLNTPKPWRNNTTLTTNWIQQSKTVFGNSPTAKVWSNEWFTSRRLDHDTKSTLVEFFGIMFEPQFTFEKLIVWTHNQLAYAAARAVAEAPWQTYNPLFLYGDVGLWKTHLMQAIGNYSITQHPQTCILYLPTTKFIDLVIDAISKRRVPELMDKFMQVDIMMLDDIQFLSKKDKTQEIFHNIFNEFVSQKKQIVVTSDQAPLNLVDLEERITSRLSTWLTVDIKTPDIETRMAIVKMKLKAKGETIQDELLEIIAKELQGNVRQIEWLINILIMKRQLTTNGILTKDDVYESIHVMGNHIQHTQNWSSKTSASANASTPVQQTMTNQSDLLLRIIQDICKNEEIDYTLVLWEGRTRAVSQIRQLTMRIAKNKFQRTLEKIWWFFGGKNHASVIYNLNTYKNREDVTSPTHTKRIAQLLEKYTAM
jgi:chromosomal replication initiator protein